MNKAAKVLLALGGKKAAPKLEETANLKLWLDGASCYTDAAKTVKASANGDLIYTLADLSGNGNDFVQATEANRPLLVTSAINGQLAWQFGNDAVNAKFAQTGKNITTILGAANAASLYVVFKGGATSGAEIYLISPVFNIMFRQDYIRGNVFDGETKIVNYSISTNATFGVLFTMDGSNITLYTGGTQRAQTAAGNITTSGAWVKIGNNTASTLSGQVAIILLYGAAHTAEQTARVYDYLNKRFGVSFS